MSDILKNLHDAIVSGDREAVLAHVTDALSDSQDPVRILNEGMMAAMKALVAQATRVRSSPELDEVLGDALEGIGW